MGDSVKRKSGVHVFMILKGHVTQYKSVLRHQCSSMSQTNKVYQDLNTHVILVSRIYTLLVWVFSWIDLLTVNKF